jgi:hypothetical protein
MPDQDQKQPKKNDKDGKPMPQEPQRNPQSNPNQPQREIEEPEPVRRDYGDIEREDKGRSVRDDDSDID